MSERRRRDSTQIKYQILMSALSGNKKTHIMYESGLNLKQLNFYLEELLTNAALEFKPQTKTYHTTEKGKAFARAIDHYRETMNQLNKQQEAIADFFPTQQSKRPIELRR
ncbi:MAG TPA: winged helix-turn-helix domain-containing protein [Nitrososphaerales archaeon]|nr:winged helix-turn-helix domain-containing protein [Nitrososphaerales archaeon]